MVDHSLVEKIAKEVGDKMFVVFWQYDANYSEPRITIANTPEQAFKSEFPLRANIKDPDFHKFAIRIRTSGDLTEIKNV